MKRNSWIAAALCILALLPLCSAAAQEPVPEPVSYTAQEIYSRSTAAVFYLRALEDGGQLKTTGTGFFISADGYALTAAHVVRSASSIQAVLDDGTEVDGVVLVAIDAETDVALLRLPAGESAYPYLELATEDCAYGEQLYAIGYPLRPVKLFTDGMAASPSAPINGLDRLLMTVPLSSGMSGGPIISQFGVVHGISSGTLKTMNGISISPTTAQILALVESGWKKEEAA